MRHGNRRTREQRRSEAMKMFFGETNLVLVVCLKYKLTEIYCEFSLKLTAEAEQLEPM